ncbi:MAG: Tex-like N-terminal domain-containing protein, partial [Paracoccaceae bacterium]|nr:Tex-like N-terminal domain-containing protein [Paracoccaceae bacterium]
MTPNLARRIATLIANEIGAQPQQVAAAVDLLDGGATVPFVARYRKEATGGLDDTQLRTLSERLGYLREMEARRGAILGSIREQGKLTADLELGINRAVTKAELEDIYLPYKPKRRTRAMIARENGLGPLTEAILADRGADPAILAAGYLGEAVPDVKTALEGARDIVAEGLAENADLLGRLRGHLKAVARMVAQVVPGKEAEGAKFSDYFAHSEPWHSAPSHRVLAMLRGRNEGVLSLDLEADADAPRGQSPAERICAAALAAGGAGKGDIWLREAAAWAWRIKLKTSLTLDLMGDLRDRAEAEAIRVFARNLKDLLLAAPAGGKATMGLDPGIRTGVKVAVVDGTGKVLATATVYPFQPRNDIRGAQADLAQLIRAHGVALIAIGNGTASRETEKLVADLLALLPG